MKWFILSFMGVLLLSCQGKTSSGTDGNKQVSVPDTVLAYKYKESGKKKSANGNQHGAIDDYTKAICFNPNYDTAYHNRGVVKAAIGDYNGAISDYNKAIEINPQLKFSFFSRGNVKVKLKDNIGAMYDFSKAIELDSNYINPYINRGVLKSKMGDIEGELSDYRLAIKICKPNADLYNNLGRALYDLERFKESAEAYGEGIKHFPKDYRLYYGRGLARKRIGDKKGACEDWMKSSELGCVQANILLPLCDEYMKERTDSLKRQNEGERTLNKSVSELVQETSRAKYSAPIYATPLRWPKLRHKGRIFFTTPPNLPGQRTTRVYVTNC